MVRKPLGKTDANREMEALIAGFEGERPRLLLHSCCGPCSTSVLERLLPYFQVEVFFYNPNIDPEEEYSRREEEQIRYLAKLGIPFHKSEYRPDAFEEAVQGHEGAPEGGSRCSLCFLLRLRATAARGEELGIPWFATTLTVSSHKNSRLVNESGEQAAKQTEGRIAYLPSDFKKKDGTKRSQELSREEGMYRQDYCGCRYSRRERKPDEQ